MLEVFEKTESQVRSYCRKYPTEFKLAKNAELFSVEGTRYIDFLAVAGRKDAVLKLMPPLTIEDDILIEGLNIVKEAVKAVLK